MIDTSTFLTLNSNVIAMADLEAVVSQLIASQTNITVSGELQLTSEDTQYTAALRFNGYAQPPRIEYTTDSGTTWNALEYSTYDWDSTMDYAAGTPVLHRASGRWYISTAATTVSDIPGESDKWRLMTLGSVVYYVDSAAKLETALESGTENLIVHISGDIGSNVYATIPATTTVAVLYSDESASLSLTSLRIACASGGTNVYWHCSGTRVTAAYNTSATVQLDSGTLWLDRLTVVSGNGLSLVTGTGAHIYYQRIDPTVTADSGSAQLQWCGQNTSDVFVPLDMTQLPVMTYDNGLSIYVQGSTFGRLTLGDIEEHINGMSFLGIDDQGTLAERPVSGSTTGYRYYATDTGDVYQWNGVSWDAGVHIQGPQGAPGVDGTAGAQGAPGPAGVSPTITVDNSAVTASTITIVDVGGTHTAIVHDGQAPTLAIGTVTTVDFNVGATVAMVYSQQLNKYTINMAVPRGESGANVFEYPMVNNSGTVSMVAYPAPPVYSMLTPVSDGTATLAFNLGKSYDLASVYPAPTVLSLQGSGTVGVYGAVRIMCAFGTAANLDIDANITQIGTLVPNAVNSIRIEYYGTAGYLYVDSPSPTKWIIEETT